MNANNLQGRTGGNHVLQPDLRVARPVGRGRLLLGLDRPVASMNPRLERAEKERNRRERRDAAIVVAFVALAVLVVYLAGVFAEWVHIL